MAIPAGKFAPFQGKGNSGLIQVVDDWYIVCQSTRLKEKPLEASLFGLPLVVFRNEEGDVAALLDRCPHRNVPLSLGRVRAEHLQCSYHGWEFDTGGVCKLVPGLVDDRLAAGRNVPSFATMERDGFIWVYASPNVEPEREPFRFPLIGEDGYRTVVRELEVEGSIHATAENVLDVPHTAFIHGGLFRSSSEQRHEIRVVIKSFQDQAEAEYIGEPRPKGVVGMLLAPGGGSIEHVDRFILPSIAQVEYRLGERTHFCVTSALSPKTGYRTRLFTVLSLRLPLAGLFITPILDFLLMKIFRQDVHILKSQVENTARFGGEQFVSTEVDVLGPHILRLLKQAERGERNRDGEATARTIQMFV